MFTVEVLDPAGETRRHFVAMALVHRFGHVAQEGLVVGTQRDIFVGLDNPRGRLALGHAEVIVAAHQAAGKSAEEDAQFEVGHILSLGNKPVLVALAVEHQQMVFLTQGNAGLVQQAVVEPDVFPLRLGGDLHHLKRCQRNVVGFSESHHISDENRGAGTQAAHRQRAFDDAVDAVAQLEALLERELGPTGIVAPVALLHQRRRGNIESHIASKSLASQRHPAALNDVEPQVNALVDGKARDNAVLMVNVSTQRADAIGRIDMILHKVYCINSLSSSW